MGWVPPASMNQYIRIACGFTLAFAALRSPVVWAQAEEAKPAKTLGQTGTVLVLDNDRTLEGDIERVGDQFRLRRGEAVSWVPPQASAVLCANLNEAYLVLRQRANLRDPDERIRLAQWCVGRGLKEEAIQEARGALELKPEYGPARRMVRHLESMRQSEAAELARGGKVPQEAEMSTSLALEMTAPSLGVFTSKVQPILMNACASCHATGRGGDFKLARVYTTNTANKRITQQNASSVMSQITPGQALASPVLVKAVSVHGDQTQPALRGRQTEPFRILESWVQQVSREHMANRPKDAEGGVIAVTRGNAASNSGEIRTAEYRPDNNAFASAPSSRPAQVPEVNPPAPPPQAKPSNPSSPSNSDPYDPDIFNGTPSAPVPVAPAPMTPAPSRPSEPAKLPPLPEAKPARD